MESEKVKEIKELLRCMNGEKACTDCYINEVAQEQETCCINVIADMTLDLINELESENERLRKDNELLRNAKVVYENVDYCYEDLKKAEKRIAELEKEIEVNAFYAKGYAQGIKNTYEVVVPDKLKQFAERLKSKDCSVPVHKGFILIEDHAIDETLEEFINGI